MCHRRTLLQTQKRLAMPWHCRSFQRWHGQDGLPRAFLNDDGLCSYAAHSTSDQGLHLLSTAISSHPFDDTAQALDQCCRKMQDGKSPSPLHTDVINKSAQEIVGEIKVLPSALNHVLVSTTSKDQKKEFPICLNTLAADSNKCNSRLNADLNEQEYATSLQLKLRKS